MTSYLRGLILFKRGRQILLFLFCLFLAFIIWSVHNLSENYSYYFLFKINVNSNIPGRESRSISNNRLALRGRSSGFYILKHKFYKSSNSLTLNLESNLFNEYGNDIFYIIPGNIKEEVIKSFGDKIAFDFFGTDTLFFNFKEVSYKEVDIGFRYSASFKDQYMQYGKASMTPSKINIYGDPQLLNEIDTIYTIYKEFNNISRDVSGLIAIEKIKGLRYSINEIYYNIDVVRFIESKIDFPEYSLSIYIRVPFKDIRLIKREDFNIVLETIDLYSINNSRVISPKLLDLPSYVISYRFDPPFISN